VFCSWRHIVIVVVVDDDDDDEREEDEGTKQSASTGLGR